jgi:glycosyltransferase involved in cell wall biosynthesis
MYQFTTSLVKVYYPSVRLSVKILSIAGPLHREFGGPPMAVTGVAESLANLGHQMTVVICGQSLEDSRVNSTFFDRLKKSGTKVEILLRKNESKYGTLLSIKEIKSLWKDFAKSDFVVLHQLFQLQYVAIFFMLIVMRTPFAVMPHGTLTTYQRKQHRVRKFAFFVPAYLFLKSSRGIFVASTQELEQLPWYFKEKGIVVGLGIDTQFNQSRSITNSTQNFNLLYMGRLAKKKRLDIALEAFALASRKSHLNMKFIICGSGEVSEVAEMTKLVADLDIKDLVEFRGWIDSADKEIAFRESHCFILTSEDENFAIAAAEALSQGIPCILSSNVALSNLVAAYKAGEVFQELNIEVIENAILKVSQGDREAYRDSSLLAASRVSWDVIARQWEEEIFRILKS